MTMVVPFVLLLAVLRLGYIIGLAILEGVLALRLATAAVIVGWSLQDREGLKSCALVPLRDMAVLVF